MQEPQTTHYQTENNYRRQTASSMEREQVTESTAQRRLPPDSIPDLMPGVDPQQTPGIDHPPAEWD